ncbi:unnamed protein product [Acanthoscelides obtectus]|uniref:Osiris 20 n=1 Tax=Acanthoscelides obtectus TaxID=200917 RepID=A0A9P0P428_ACAOB|nr:unnamed protein product [Acanthoscelides obtectus]CAK1648107.1 hypothetical protein AOBTE_LOCUS15544 [Acanthoscelides obtectus]
MLFRLSLLIAIAALGASAQGVGTPRTSEQLVNTVLERCGDMGCVKERVLEYLDSLLNIQTDARSAKNIDAAIFKRVARVIQTHEFRVQVPEVLMEKTEIVYNPKTGLDIDSKATEDESRALGLKKKLLFPLLLLFKLKMKLLMPIFLALIGLKATKALILSKLAILIVLGFIAYQYLGKSGMMPMMPMSMTPMEPAPMYGAPAPPPSTPSSYEPGWEPNQGGPYQRVWTGAQEAQNMAYSAYYQNDATSSTSRP